MAVVPKVEDRIVSGKKFAGERKRLALSQQEFASALGMSLSNVRRVEYSGTTTIQPKYFRNLALLLKIGFDDLAERLSPGGAGQMTLSADLSATIRAAAAIEKKDPEAWLDDLVSITEQGESGHGQPPAPGSKVRRNARNRKRAQRRG